MEHNDRGRTTSKRDSPGHGMHGGEKSTLSFVVISELHSKIITCTFLYNVHTCV